MEGSVCPAPYGVVRGVFPRLKAIAMIQIMGRLPVIEDLVAVLYRREKGSN
jgi:hypothetical protein